MSLTKPQLHILKILGNEIKTTGDIAREIYGEGSNGTWRVGRILSKLQVLGYIRYVEGPKGKWGWKKRAKSYL